MGAVALDKKLLLSRGLSFPIFEMGRVITPLARVMLNEWVLQGVLQVARLRGRVPQPSVGQVAQQTWL